MHNLRRRPNAFLAACRASASYSVLLIISFSKFPHRDSFSGFPRHGGVTKTSFELAVNSMEDAL
jgi:hypothetical protein